MNHVIISSQVRIACHVEVVEEEENFSNFGKFKGKVGSKIFRFFFRFSLFLAPRGRSMKGS